jgi:hypothetical protein
LRRRKKKRLSFAGVVDVEYGNIPVAARGWDARGKCVSSRDDGNEWR